MSLFAELKRRNVFRVAMLYLVASWLLLQVADVGVSLLGLPEWIGKAIVLFLAIGFPLVLIFSWIFELTPEGLKREKDLDRSQSVTAHTSHRINTLIVVLLVLAIAAVVVDRMVPEAVPVAEAPAIQETPAAATDPRDPAILAAGKFAPAPDRSIAVLPFVNMSGNQENEYFADGLSEEILNVLTGIPDLKVTARTSSFQFKGKNADLREVGEALNVAHLLEGSVRRAGDKARITAQLIRAKDGYHLWSETYDRTLEDTFEVQTDIAESVSRALGVVMDDAQRERMRSAGVRNVEAFIYFQRGRERFYDAHSNEIDMRMLEESADLFTEAIRLEPQFADAYFLRSDVHAHGSTAEDMELSERDAHGVSYLEDLAAASMYARSPAQKALIEVDRTLASSNWSALPDRFAAALAFSTCAEGVWIQMAPAWGFADQALIQNQGYIECDPLDFFSYYNSAAAALWSGQPELALEFADRGLALGLDADFLQDMAVRALLAMGRLEEASDRASSHDSWSRATLLTYVAAASGETAQAREQAKTAIESSGQWRRMYVRLILSAIVGDRETANRTASWFDQLPNGQLMLASTVFDCMCGAPFDLAATPVFRQRIDEAEFTWPRAAIIDYPAMRE
jgi:TolB-like protein